MSDWLDTEARRRGLIEGGAARPPAAGDWLDQEAARRGITDSGPSFYDEAKAVASGPNSVLANVMGFPMDASNWLLRQVGIDIDSDASWGGSASVKRGMNSLGIATDEKPQTAGGRIAKRVAEELTTAPLMMAGGMAARAAGAAGPIVGALTSNPGTQLLASGTAGIGGGFAREVAPDSAAADVVGSLAGGVVGSALPSLGRYAWEMGGALTAPFREEGKQAIVGRTLQRMSSAGDNLGLALDDSLAGRHEIIPGSRPTTSQLLQDDALAATERGMRSDPKVSGQFALRSAQQSAARKSALDTGIPSDHGGAVAVKGAVENRVAQFTEFADDIIRSTEDEVRQAVGRLGPTTDPETVGNTIRQAIQSRRDHLAMLRERATKGLYDAARSEVAPINPNPALDTLEQALTVAKGDIAGPLEKARSTFFTRGTQMVDTSPEGLMGTRQALTAMLADPSVPKHSKSIIKEAQRQLDDAIEAVSPTFREANRLYRELSIPITRMDEKISGDVLRQNPALARTGGPAYETPGSAVPSKFIRRGAPEAARELTEVTLHDPSARDAISGHLATSLRDFATKEDGTINPVKWRRWIAENRAALDQNPALRQQMESLQSAQGVVDSLAGRKARTLADIQKGALGFLLKQDPDSAIESILNSKSGAQEMERLVGFIGKNPDAQNALRRSLVDRMIEDATTTGVDSMGNRILSPAKSIGFVDAHRDKLAAAFKDRPGQLKLIEDVVKDIQRANWSNTGGKMTGSPTSQNLSTANLVGAMFRGTINPSNPLAQGSLGRVMQWVLKLPETQMHEMLVDAMMNPVVARAMLKPATPYNLELIMRPFQQRMLATTGITATQDRSAQP